MANAHASFGFTCHLNSTNVCELRISLVICLCLNSVFHLPSFWHCGSCTGSSVRMTPGAAPFNGLFQVNLGQPVPLILPSLFWKTTCGSVFCRLVVPVTQLCQSTELLLLLLPFNVLFSRTTWVSRYQKSKTNLDFTGTRDSEWQWHQLGHMQVCTSLQTDNHASTPPLSFFTGRMPSCCPTNSVKSLKPSVLSLSLT